MPVFQSQLNLTIQLTDYLKITTQRFIYIVYAYYHLLFYF